MPLRYDRNPIKLSYSTQSYWNWRKAGPLSSFPGAHCVKIGTSRGLTKIILRRLLVVALLFAVNLKEYERKLHG